MQLQVFFKKIVGTYEFWTLYIYGGVLFFIKAREWLLISQDEPSDLASAISFGYLFMVASVCVSCVVIFGPVLRLLLSKINIHGVKKALLMIATFLLIATTPLFAVIYPNLFEFATPSLSGMAIIHGVMMFIALIFFVFFSFILLFLRYRS